MPGRESVDDLVVAGTRVRHDYTSKTS
jgi:hypothetical protein